jgi:hypothetical protein
MMTKKEISVLRDLAARYGEIAADARQQEAIGRMRDTNDLKVVRPPVLIDEIPWHELDWQEELRLRTEDPEARTMETFFRRALYRRAHFRCDALMEPFYPVHKCFTSTGNGLEQEERQLSTDKRNNIVSHEYHDVLPDLETLEEKFHLPVITAYPEKDAENLARIREILGDSLTAELQGVGVYYAPWDRISTLRGVENIFIDMVDDPDLLHEIIRRFTAEGDSLYEQYERLGLLDANIPALHCTPAYVTGSPRTPGPMPHQRKDLWFRSMAQTFTSVSPEMHWEFDLQYSVPLMEKFAFTYYGCCEALDKKIPMLKEKIPNLRKIGVSPWADVDVCAEEIGGDYVYARKPNPANVATVAEPEVIAEEIEATVKACQRCGCPAEFVLKDISTVGNRSENLDIWAATVSDVLDRYY